MPTLRGPPSSNARVTFSPFPSEPPLVFEKHRLVLMPAPVFSSLFGLLPTRIRGHFQQPAHAFIRLNGFRVFFFYWATYCDEVKSNLGPRRFRPSLQLHTSKVGTAVSKALIFPTCFDPFFLVPFVHRKVLFLFFFHTDPLQDACSALPSPPTVLRRT